MSLDLDAIKARLLAGPGSTAADIAFSLIAEVERLRANAEARERFLRREGNSLRATERVRDDLRLRLHRLNEILINSHDLAGKAERADVVAWLRAWGGDRAVAADAIERGEHRREEEP